MAKWTPCLIDVIQVVAARLLVEQRRADDDAARGVEHVDDGLRVARRNLHRRVLLRGRRTADQQGRPKVQDPVGVKVNLHL